MPAVHFGATDRIQRPPQAHEAVSEPGEARRNGSERPNEKPALSEVYRPLRVDPARGVSITRMCGTGSDRVRRQRARMRGLSSRVLAFITGREGPMNPRVSGSSSAVTATAIPSDATSRPLTVPRLRLPVKKTRPIAALKTSGCELIFRDNASGGRWDRPELHKLLSQLRKGDVLIVWTLDRLSRSLRDVLTIRERVQERHAGFRSLKEAVDTTTPAGRMMMQMVGAFAEFERAMLKERTKAGLDAARKEGRIGGRPPKLKPHQQQEIVTLVKQGKKTAADAARLFGVHPATVSRLLRRT